MHTRYALYVGKLELELGLGWVGVGILTEAAGDDRES